MRRRPDIWSWVGWPPRDATYPAKTGRLTNVVLMLAHRLRRWTNIKTTLAECPAMLFSGHVYGIPQKSVDSLLDSTSLSARRTRCKGPPLT